MVKTFCLNICSKVELQVRYSQGNIIDHYMVWPESRLIIEVHYFFLVSHENENDPVYQLKELSFSSILFSRFRLLCSNSFTHIEHQVSTDLLGHLGASLDWQLCNAVFSHCLQTLEYRSLLKSIVHQIQWKSERGETEIKGLKEGWMLSF